MYPPMHHTIVNSVVFHPLIHPRFHPSICPPVHLPFLLHPFKIFSQDSFRYPGVHSILITGMYSTIRHVLCSLVVASTLYKLKGLSSQNFYHTTRKIYLVRWLKPGQNFIEIKQTVCLKSHIIWIICYI